MANDYGNLGIVYKTKGELEKAVEYYEKSLAITEKRWSDIERGMYAIGLATLAKIAKSLNLPIQELFEFEEAKRQKVKNHFPKKNLLLIDKQIAKMEREITSLKKAVRVLLKPIK